MKKWWNKTVREYFTFSAGERNGLVVLCLAILAAIVYPQIVAMFHKEPSEDFTGFKKQVDSFQQAIALTDSNSSFQQVASGSEERLINDSVHPAILFYFNPNTASANDLKKLGLNDRLIHTILNYRSKGGQFRKKEDLSKIYGLSEQEYARLAPYIVIGEQEKALSADERKVSVIPAKIITKLDLNNSDSASWTSLPMIGPVLSSRIIKFREKLGGFYSVEQLKEIYGLSPEAFDAIKEKVSVNADDIVKLHLNTITLDELKQHPYFRAVAKTIISYRDQHGSFGAIEEIKNTDVITDEAYKKMVAYITL